ncbi:MAG: L-threonylcarbamoyladenylate synthase [Blastocatellia bacterium]
MTQVIRVDPDHPQPADIETAASIIRDGGLVAFPTETVYGLGADATSQSAVLKIFEAKRRPADNPVIVHVSGREMVDFIASDITDKAERLVQRFWPGPLTLVLTRKPEIAPGVSAGLATVAVRMPESEVALALIRRSGRPIAAPSANVSGRPSPTTAAHVLADLDGRIDLILDGGTTDIGIESTVLDLTVDPPSILRPGWITTETLTSVIGAVELAASEEELRHSPGTRHGHYRPRARLVLIERGSTQRLDALCEEELKKGAVGFIGHTLTKIDHPSFNAIILEESAAAYAHSIYSAIRELDERGAKVIVVEGISKSGEGAAVMDRIRRAASRILS